jgi:DbpA RNA binding domain
MTDNTENFESDWLQRIKESLDHPEIEVFLNKIDLYCQQLGITQKDMAAAMLVMSKFEPTVTTDKSIKSDARARERSFTSRFVRYRLDVGSQHRVSREQIQTVLVEESGVEKKRIGRIDIRHNHSLVELPEGMPADIFQILYETELCERRLAIKRIRNSRRVKSKSASRSTKDDSSHNEP